MGEYRLILNTGGGRIRKMKKILFKVTTRDVQYLAKKKIGRKLTLEELEQIQKGVEFGLECWEDVVIYAIQEVAKEKMKY